MSSDGPQTVVIPVKTTADLTGVKQTEQGLKDLGEHAEGAGEKLKELGYSANSLKAAFIEMFAAAELMNQFKEGVEEAMLLSGAFRRMEMQANATGQSFEEVKTRTMEVAEHWKNVAGVADEIMIPMIQRAYTMWGTMDEAVKAINLSMAISAKSGKTVEESFELVRGAAVGQTKALAQLGIGLEDASGKTEKSGNAMKLLAEYTKGATIAGGSLSVQLNRLKADWDDLRGMIVGPALDAFLLFFNSGKTTFRVLGEGAEKLLLTTSMWATKLGIIGTGLMELASGKSSFKQLMSNLGEAEKEYQTKYAAITAKSAEAAQKQIKETGKTAVEVNETEIPKSLVKGAATAKHVAEQAASDRLATEIKVATAINEVQTDAVKKRLNQILIYNLEYKKALLDLVIADKNTLSERMALHTIWQANMFKVQGEASKQYQKSVDTLNALIRKKNVELEKEMTKDIEEATKARTAIIVQSVHDRIKAEKMALDATIAIGNQTVALAGEVFGQTKEVQIAGALMSTFQGVAGALAQTSTLGYGAYVLAALVLATGLAQVANIQNTNIGSTGSSTPSNGANATSRGGFDDPANDRAAYMAGRGWAADAVKQMVGGISSGWQDGMAGGFKGGSSSVTNNRSLTVRMDRVTFQNGADLSTVKQFKRQLDALDRQVDSARITARAGRIGA